MIRKLSDSLNIQYLDELPLFKGKAGLEVLRLKYFKDPNLLRPASWEQRPCLMYWNRTGMVGPDFLGRLCAELRIKKLLFQSQIDPLVPLEFGYRLPSRLGGTIVEELPTFLPREQYLQVMAQTNLDLAPRSSEGVGMTFLEAMARGCGVLAYDAPTMNEYIDHGRNGYLLKKPPDKLTLLDRVMRRIRLSARKSVVCSLSLRQDWAGLRATDWRALGDAAHKEHMVGFQDWQRSLPRFAAFIEGSGTGLNR